MDGKLTLAEQKEALHIAISSIDDEEAIAALLQQAQDIVAKQAQPELHQLLVAELLRRAEYARLHPEEGILLEDFIREIEEDDRMAAAQEIG